MSASAKLVGQRFGRWLVVSRLPSTSYGKSMWEVLCDCGGKGSVSTGNLKSGLSVSCGCLVVETTGRLNKTHGESGKNKTTFEWRVWRAMIGRCYFLSIIRTMVVEESQFVIAGDTRSKIFYLTWVVLLQQNTA